MYQSGQCAADVYHEGVEEEAFQEAEVFLIASKTLADAQGGITELAKKTELKRIPAS